MMHIGVDGCRRGWFYVRLEGEEMEAGVSKTLQEIVAAADDQASVFVDIPIGLRDDTPYPRGCDTAARKLLGAKRASSVFPAPIRAILQEHTYAEATNKSRNLTGKGISQQAFAIIPKIREVDELLTTSDRARRIIREVHPEVCFWGLNSGHAMLHTKKKKDGFGERMTLLTQLLPLAEDMVNSVLAKYRRKDVARDDIADALVALATSVAPQETIHTVPFTPERDSRGLPMEMVYSLRGNAHAL